MIVCSCLLAHFQLNVTCLVTSMAVLQPKTKREFAREIASRCAVMEEELMVHGVDRLREIWKLVKPAKRAPVLNPGWKKASRDTLKAIYTDTVVPDLGRSLEDLHWDGWNRSQFLLEIELWEAEVKSQMTEEIVAEKSQAPECASCRLQMIQRTNRLTRQDFWGCIRYPVCQETLSMTYAGQPVAMVQKAVKESKAKAAPGYKMKGQPGVASEASWIPVSELSEAHQHAVPVSEESETEEKQSQVSMNLSPAEVDKIIKGRQEAAVKRRTREKSAAE